MNATLSITTASREELKDITAELDALLRRLHAKDGVCVLHVPHTTAGVLVNENADPAVARDILRTLEKLAPHKGPYEHLEGNADAHIKSVLVGTDRLLPVQKGRLVLGRWQGVFFCEFDGPRTRELRVTVIPS